MKIAAALLAPVILACPSAPPAPPIDLTPFVAAVETLVSNVENLIAQVAVTPPPTTTTTTTTTTRGPSQCEIERDGLIASNPDNEHVPTCMTDGAYKPDQYQSDGINYCVTVDGDKIQDTLRNAPWVQNGARYEECLALRQ